MNFTIPCIVCYIPFETEGVEKLEQSFEQTSSGYTTSYRIHQICTKCVKDAENKKYIETLKTVLKSI